MENRSNDELKPAKVELSSLYGEFARKTKRVDTRGKVSRTFFAYTIEAKIYEKGADQVTPVTMENVVGISETAALRLARKGIKMQFEGTEREPVILDLKVTQKKSILCALDIEKFYELSEKYECNEEVTE